MKGGRGGRGPSTSVLKLRLASRMSNPSKIARLVDDVLVVAGVNTRVPHLEGERVFGSAKRKLDLPPGDETDSHHHDRVNYSVPKLSKKGSPSQSRIALSIPSNANMGRSSKASSLHGGVVRTKTGLPVLELSCANLMSWRIERIFPSYLDLCRGHSASGVKYNAKIAKYRRAVAASTFNGIQRLRKSRETEQMQFWFCPGKLQACIKDTRSRSIVHFSVLPHAWAVQRGTNLTQAGVDDFEASGFSLCSGVADLGGAESGLPLEVLLDVVPNPLSSVVDVQPINPELIRSPAISDDDRRPKHQSGKLFRFVAVPSTDHYLKMESSKAIECTVLKSMMVLELGLGVVFTVITPGSISKKELYEVTISNFPSCTYRGFRYMCASVLGNPSKKWILCKHLYFILQIRMYCTADDSFIHCPGWTANEVRLLMGRMD